MRHCVLGKGGTNTVYINCHVLREMCLVEEERNCQKARCHLYSMTAILQHLKEDLCLQASELFQPFLDWKLWNADDTM